MSTTYIDEASPNTTVYSKICGDGGIVEEAFALQNPDFAINAYVSIPVVQDYPLLTSSVSAFKISKLTGFTQAGTVTLSIEIDGVAVPGLTNILLTSSETEFIASGTLDVVAVGARVVASVSAVSTPDDMEFTIHAIR